MNIFLSGEQRRMHRYVDSTLEHTLALMALDGFREDVDADIFDHHKKVIDNFFIPNVRHGQVSMPKSARNTEAVPIVGLEPEQEILYGTDALPTPLQKYRIAKRIQSWTQRSSLATIMLEVEDDHYPFANSTVSMPQGLAAAVRTPVTGVRIPSDNIERHYRRLLLGRPLVVLAMEGGDHQAPSTVFHESRHVMQTIVEPFTESDETYRRTQTFRQELEAYATQAIFERAMAKQPTYQPPAGEDNAPTFIERDDGSRFIYSSALVISILRHEVNKNRRDGFFPAKELIKKLEEYGIDLA